MNFDKIIQFVFPNFPATFYSDFPLETSLVRLRQSMASRSFLALVGDATEHDVHMYRSNWGGRWRYPMIFEGRFHRTDAGLVLEGHFSLTVGSRIWLCSQLAYASLIFAVPAWTHPETFRMSVPCLIGIWSVSVAFIRRGQRKQSNQRWISRRIAHALSHAEPLDQSLQPGAGAASA